MKIISDFCHLHDGGACLKRTIKGMKPVHAYCLHCETQRCGTVAELIRRNYGYYSFSPQIIQRKWVKGIPTEEKHDWLPGYVFVYTDEPIHPRFDIDGIIRCLGKGELTGQDLLFAEMLYQKKGVMGSIALIQAGDQCIITDPSWDNLQGRVIKMDRGRKRCCVEFEFDGVRRTIWVGFDMLEPQQNNE